MMTYRSWTWLDDATEEQTENVANKAAVERLAAEARQLYDSIPDPQDERTQERRDCAYEAAYEEGGEEAVKKLKQRWSDEKKSAFGQLEAIEELMAVRGARFARDYEHWNEDEKRIELAENSDDHYDRD